MSSHRKQAYQPRHARPQDHSQARPRILAGGAAAALAVAAPLALAGGAAQAATAPVPSGTLGCEGLETLWADAGGNPADEVTAASIAMAESSGEQYALSPTDDYGYWQINGSHGAEATYNPLGNARAAIAISSDGRDWNPWTTYTEGLYVGKCPGVVLTAERRPAVHRHVIAHADVSTVGNRALNWAETQTGVPYQWGGTGDPGYDCSGLVMTAFEHEGIQLPRTTWEMPGSSHLHRVSVPRRGDIAFFFNSSHVEFVTVWPHTTFGAHDTGSTIGWIGWGAEWPPGTVFYSVS